MTLANDALEQRVTVMEDFIQGHVATREQVDALDAKVDALDTRLDRLETDVKDIKTDIAEILNYVRP